MLAKMIMKLSETENMSYQMASLFHGALMERIPKDYADELHISKLHQYTQHLERIGEDWYWVVTAFDDNAIKIILKETLSYLEHINIKKKQLRIDVIDKKYLEVKDRELAEIIYKGRADRYVTLQFLTPTAFKINGKYINYPEIRSLFTNLINKYDAANSEESLKDEDTLEMILGNTEISRYDLRSTSFSIEGIRIPSFIGKLTLRFSGTQTMCNFIKMLFKFGEFSGVGIKTALGMGAVRILEKQENRNDG